MFTSKKNGQPYHPVTAVGQLQYIFAMLQFGNRKSLDPTNLAIALSLDTRTQQDAQEFSKLLLCHIERKLQQNTALTHTLQRLSQGKYSYVNWCVRRMIFSVVLRFISNVSPFVSFLFFSQLHYVQNGVLNAHHVLRT